MSTLTRPDIPTALTEAEADALAALAFGGRVLEVGALLGHSTVILADAADHVVSVDPHVGYPADDPRPTLNRFLRNLEKYNVREKVTVMIGRDDQVLPYLEQEQFDLIFIDCTGEHDVTAGAMCRAERLLTPHGYLAVHDCGHPHWQGVRQAVEEFAIERKLGFTLTDRLAVFKP